MNLDVGFDDPMVSVRAEALEEKRVRPVAPLSALVQMPLCAADDASTLVMPPHKPTRPGCAWRSMNSRLEIPSAMMIWFFMANYSADNKAICVGPSRSHASQRP